MKYFVTIFLLCFAFMNYSNAETGYSGTIDAPKIGGDYSIKSESTKYCSENLADCEAKAESGDMDSLYALAIKDIETPKKGSDALQKLDKLAKQGHVNSQAVLGMLLIGWEGIDTDLEKARYWWNEAAKGGHKEAKQNIGIMYYYGDGGEQNYKKAFDLFKEVASDELPQAQFYLGMSYFEGKAVEQDMDMAMQLLKTSANNNYVIAQKVYGSALIGANRIEEGYLWMGQAAIQGDERALSAIKYLEKEKIKDANKIEDLRQKALQLQDKLKNR